MVLFISDNISTLNGMSIFSNYFINWLKINFDNNICVLEAQKNQIISIKQINDDNIIDKIFVNGHFSESDFLIRNRQLTKIVSDQNFLISEECSFTIISHGWQKVKNRFNFYSVLYNLKNISKTKNIDSISKFYNSIIFISNKSDQFRHFDFNWCVKNNFSFDYIDFSKEICLTKTTENNITQKNYILIISNFDTVKNLLLLFRINLTNFFIRKKPKNFVLLSTYPKSFRGKIIYQLLIFSKINVVLDQTQKINLISNCNYLFIPSYTEYLPIVAFEAFSMKKKVLSYYYIIGLSEKDDYHFIKK
jgi:hypothetical protein